MGFLQLCQDCGLKLSIEKVTLKQTEVSFIAHVATGDGLPVDTDSSLNKSYHSWMLNGAGRMPRSQP